MTDAWQVHNHGTEDGPGLSCGERRLPDGRLAGRCLGDLTDAPSTVAPWPQVNLYSVGDPDPTRTGPVPCDAVAPGRFGFVCTWPKGHTHPQHVAGDAKTVCATWPVLPTATTGASDV